MPWGLTPAHLIIILVIVLIVVGPGRLPETGAAIGKALRGFKDAVETGETKNGAAAQPPVQPTAQQYPAQYVPPQPTQYPPQQPYVPQQPMQYPPQQAVQYPPQGYPQQPVPQAPAPDQAATAPVEQPKQ